MGKQMHTAVYKADKVAYCIKTETEAVHLTRFCMNIKGELQQFSITKSWKN